MLLVTDIVLPPNLLGGALETQQACDQLVKAQQPAMRDTLSCNAH